MVCRSFEKAHSPSKRRLRKSFLRLQRWIPWNKIRSLWTSTFPTLQQSWITKDDSYFLTEWYRRFYHVEAFIGNKSSHTSRSITSQKSESTGWRQPRFLSKYFVPFSGLCWYWWSVRRNVWLLPTLPATQSGSLVEWGVALQKWCFFGSWIANNLISCFHDWEVSQYHINKVWRVSHTFALISHSYRWITKAPGVDSYA